MNKNEERIIKAQKIIDSMKIDTMITGIFKKGRYYRLNLLNKVSKETKHISYEELIKNRYIPKFDKYINLKRVEKAQAVLSKMDKNFKALNDFSKDGLELTIKIINLDTKELKYVQYHPLIRGTKPKFEKYDFKIKIKEINLLGEKSNPKYSVIDIWYDKNIEACRVKVKSKKDGSVKGSAIYHLKAGHNPFNETQDRHEEKVVQPKVLNILKKNKNILKIEKEVVISKKSRPDFVITTKNNRKIIIEVKSDKKRHSSNELSQQISRYKKEGKIKYGNLYKETILVSEMGIYGLSLKELSIYLSQI